MSWIEDVKYELNKLDISVTALRKFGITIGIVFILISIWLLYKNISLTIIILITTFSLFLIFAGSFYPQKLNKIYHFWMGLALILGWFVSRFLLTILFIFVLTPIAIFAKVFKKDFLDLSIKKIRQSNWKKKENKFPNYEKMY